VFKGRLASHILCHYGVAQHEDIFDKVDIQFDSFKKIQTLKDMKLIKPSYSEEELRELQNDVQEG
jgi:hypothetical protein